MVIKDDTLVGDSKRKRPKEEVHEHSDEAKKLLKKTEKIISSVARTKKTHVGRPAEANEA